MKTYLKVFGIAILSVGLQACSHGVVEKQIDDKVAQEAAVNDRAGLIAESKQVIEKDTGLTSDQKTKLISLRALARTKTDEVVAASNKLKAVLIKDIMSEHYDEAEVKLIKERLHHLEDERLAILFGALDEVNSILGHDAPKHQAIANDFLDRSEAHRH